MKIYCYHENIGLEIANLPLVYLWQEMWQKLGWEAVILDENVARKHPDYTVMATAFSKFPSVNRQGYDAACFKRWLAMEVVGGGFMSDYDTIGYTFTPRPSTERLTLWNGGACPCLVSGSASEYGRMARRFAAWEPTHKDRSFPSGFHISDQNILDQCPGEFSVERAVVQYRDTGWEQAAVVHYAGCVMRDKQPKFVHIPGLR